MGQSVGHEATRVGTAIIGGGIVGVTLAFYLAELGEKDIVVLEGRELASGCTGGSLGGVRQQFSTAPEIELAIRGRRFWQTFEEVFEHPCQYHQDGYLMMTGREELYHKLGEAAKAQAAAGAPHVEMLRASEMKEIVPWLETEGLVGACWTPEDGRVNPTDGVYGVAAAARRLGVKIREQFFVGDISEVEGGWLVEGPEPLLAERVVIAGGLGSPKMLKKFGIDVDIFPMWVHYGFTTPVLGDQRLPMTIDLDTGWCVEREQDGAMVTILSSDLPEKYGVSDMLAEFAEVSEVRAPLFSEVGIRNTISAAADATGGDGHPFIGEIEPGLWSATGFDGHGTMMGPAASQMLAKLMLGMPDPVLDVAIFDPHREATENLEWLRAARK